MASTIYFTLPIGGTSVLTPAAWSKYLVVAAVISPAL